MIDKLKIKKTLNIILIKIEMYKSYSKKKNTQIIKKIMQFENEFYSILLFSSSQNTTIECIYIIDIEKNIEIFIKEFEVKFKKTVKKIKFLFSHEDKIFIEKKNIYKLFISIKYDLIKHNDAKEHLKLNLQQKIKTKDIYIVDIKIINNEFFEIDFITTEKQSLVDAVDLLKTKSSLILNKFTNINQRTWGNGFALTNTNILTGTALKEFKNTKKKDLLDEKIETLLYYNKFIIDHLAFFKSLDK